MSDSPALAAGDIVEAIVKDHVQPTLAVLMASFLEQVTYRDSDFPMTESAYADFQETMVSSLRNLLIPNGLECHVEEIETRALGTITLDVRLVHVQPEGVAVPIVLCLPAGSGSARGVACYSGHSAHGLRDLLEPDSYQAGIACRLAEAGFATVAVEKLDTGTLVRTVGKGSDEPQIASHLLAWGDCTRSLQIRACLAAVETLMEHPRVEGPVGAVGVSLGGWLAVITALLDERIAAVADFGMKTRFLPPDRLPADYDGIFDPCHILPGLNRLGDRNLIPLALAPRRLLAGHGAADPASSAQAEPHYRRLQQAQYAALGAADRFAWHVHPGGDTLPPQPVIDFFRDAL